MELDILPLHGNRWAADESNTCAQSNEITINIKTILLFTLFPFVYISIRLVDTY